jgi:hypothetical protein
VFLKPKVLAEAFPAVRTRVSSATSDQPVSLSSWAVRPEVGNRTRRMEAKTALFEGTRFFMPNAFLFF